MRNKGIPDQLIDEFNFFNSFINRAIYFIILSLIFSYVCVAQKTLSTTANRLETLLLYVGGKFPRPVMPKGNHEPLRPRKFKVAWVHLVFLRLTN